MDRVSLGGLVDRQNMNSTIREFDDRVEIHLQNLLTCFVMMPVELLEYQVWSLRKRLNGRKVQIHAFWQTPIFVQPYCGLVDMIADLLALRKDQLEIHVQADNPGSHDRASTRRLTNLAMKSKWFSQNLAALKPNIGQLDIRPDARRFGALFGRFQLPRMIIAHWLEHQHSDQSYVMCHWHASQIDGATVGFESDRQQYMTWYTTRKNPLEVGIKGENHLGTVSGVAAATDLLTVHGHFHIEISVETNYHSHEKTEKTWRCLATKKPFFMLTGQGSMAALRQTGFKTFSPFFDESYDDLANVYDRLTAIQAEVDRICAMSQQEFDNLCQNLQPILDHNQRLILNDNKPFK